MKMMAAGPPRTTPHTTRSLFKSQGFGWPHSSRPSFPARTAQVACCKRIVRCSATEEHGLGDLDGKDRPHPTKTALSKLKKAQISEALRARGLPYEGLKRELVNRLHSALQRAAVGGLTGDSGGGGGGRSPLVIAAAALAEAPAREAVSSTSDTERDADIGHLQRRIAELDAELASFKRQVANVTAERDAERAKLEHLAAGIEAAQTAMEDDRARVAELLEAAAALEANEAELARLRATQAGFLERVEHLQMLLKSKDAVIGQLQRQLAEAAAAEAYPRSHPLADTARASPSSPVSRGVRSVEVPGVALATGALTVAVAAGTVYAASRRLLPPEQRRVLDIGTGLVALAAAAYLLHI